MARPRALVAFLSLLVVPGCAPSISTIWLEGVVGDRIFVTDDGVVLVARDGLRSFDRAGALRAFSERSMDTVGSTSLDHGAGVLLEGTSSELVIRDATGLRVDARFPVVTGCDQVFAADREGLCVGLSVSAIDLATGAARSLPMEIADGSVRRHEVLPGRRVLLDLYERSLLLELAAEPARTSAIVPMRGVDALYGSPPTHALWYSDVCGLYRLDGCPGSSCLEADGALDCVPVDASLGLGPLDLIDYQRWAAAADGRVFRLMPASCEGAWCHRVYQYGPTDRSAELVATVTEPLGQLIGLAHDPVTSELVVAGRVGCDYDDAGEFSCLATVIRRIAVPPG